MKTYDEWLAKGRHVIRGEKCSGWSNDGVALFKKSQTAKLNYNNQSYGTGRYCSYDYNDIDYDDPLTFDPWMFN